MNCNWKLQETALKTIKSELNEFKAYLSPNSFYHIEPESKGDFFRLKGYVHGPPGTPYQDGIFHLKISLPKSYPVGAPTVRMTTKVWHPNIDELGNIILEDILGSEWNLSMSIHTVMMSIQNLLGSPNMDSGLMSKAACIMKQDLEVFQKTVAFWTYHYAIVIKTEQMITDNAPFEVMIHLVMIQKGINYDGALNILSANCWNILETLVADTLYL